MNHPLKWRAALATLVTIAGWTPVHAQGPTCAAGSALAFIGVTIVNVDSGTMSAPAIVLVENERVSAVNAPSVPAGACRIAAAGKFLVPGLADMHVHTASREMPLFLANGVTTVREMNGSPAHLALRDSIRRGQVAGPRMLVASTLLVGAANQFRHRVVRSADDARKAAREIKEAGYDYLKIYDALPRPAYDAFVEESKSLGLPLDGHIPQPVGLDRVLEAGQSIQHVDKIAFALAGHSGDTAKFADLRRLLAGRRVWVTPTLASLRVLDATGTNEYAARLGAPEVAFADSGLLAWWRSLAGTRTYGGNSNYYRYLLSTLRVLDQSGVRFLAGTDAANPMMVAGFSLHDELETLVRDAGFTRLAALQAATVNVGAFTGIPLIGRIVPGAPADLLLVGGNPLGDLSVLRVPEGVVAAGRWYPRQALDRMLREARLR